MADTHLTLIGNLTDDPDLCAFPNGTQVANVWVAVTVRIRDGDSWRDGDTSFFRVNVWRQLAEHAAESLSKGDRAVVIGRLKSRSWETPEGDKRSVVEVEADEVAPRCAGRSPSPSERPATARPSRAASSTTTPLLAISEAGMVEAARAGGRAIPSCGRWAPRPWPWPWKSRCWRPSGWGIGRCCGCRGCCWSPRSPCPPCSRSRSPHRPWSGT